jgi:hypothetical protein
LRIPLFYTIGSLIVVRLPASRTCSALLPQTFFSVSGTHFYQRLSKPKSLVRLEALGKLKTVNDLIGSRTRDLPACSIVPQPTTLPRDLSNVNQSVFKSLYQYESEVNSQLLTQLTQLLTETSTRNINITMFLRSKVRRVRKAIYVLIV